MTISHKVSIFDNRNVAEFSHHEIMAELRNMEKTIDFDVRKYRLWLLDALSAKYGKGAQEKVDKIMAELMKPCDATLPQKSSSWTAADEARQQRKKIKRGMKSRRK